MNFNYVQNYVNYFLSPIWVMVLLFGEPLQVIHSFASQGELDLKPQFGLLSKMWLFVFQSITWGQSLGFLFNFRKKVCIKEIQGYRVFEPNLCHVSSPRWSRASYKNSIGFHKNPKTFVWGTLICIVASLRDFFAHQLLSLIPKLDWNS